MARNDVRELIEREIEERANRTRILVDDVLDRLWRIATADPAELVSLHRYCCRYCYGKNYRYQLTSREQDERRAAHAAKHAGADCSGAAGVCFDEQGGTGFHRTSDPNPDCPECVGMGLPEIVNFDLRDVSPNARALYAGVQMTLHGPAVFLHDRMLALSLVAKHLGMFNEKSRPLPQLLPHAGVVSITRQGA